MYVILLCTYVCVCRCLRHQVNEFKKGNGYQDLGAFLGDRNKFLWAKEPLKGGS